MLQRFASGCLVAAVVVAVATIALLLIPGLSIQRVAPVLTAWCLVPLVWGVWAMVAPQRWVPQYLPLWGATLGVIAGIFGAFVLNMPARIFGEGIPIMVRSVGVVVMVVFYYCLWILVGIAYNRLTSADKAVETPKSMGTAA